MGRIKTLESLVEVLDEDLQWRKKEIASFRFLHMQTPDYECLIRAGLAFTCAHFEGFIKFASDAYVEYISSLRVSCSQLRTELVSMLVKKNFSQTGLSDINKVKISTVSSFLSLYEDILGGNFEVKQIGGGGISTQSNPTPDVLKEITNILGLDYDYLFEIRNEFINSKLLAPRNNIVHGRRWRLVGEDLKEAENYVVEMLEKYKEAIIKAAEDKTFLKQ